MKLKVFQKGFNVAQDGPGNRLVYHLQGCNMRCEWCANPESFNREGSLMIKEKQLLDSVCPYGAIRKQSLDRSFCKTCSDRVCITTHKNQGIRMSCQEYEIESLVEEVLRSRPLFYDGGGVTLTGGEATLQFDAVERFLKTITKLGIHTVLETNATHPNLEQLFPYLGRLIMDFKHYDNEKHKKYTGIGNAEIIRNMKKAFNLHPDVLVRIPLIKGFNHTVQDAQIFSDFFLQESTNHVMFEMLPYHEYGRIKWQQCGYEYRPIDAKISKRDLEEYEKVFKNNNLICIRS